MNSVSRYSILALLTFSAFLSCKPKNDNSKVYQNTTAETKETEENEDEEHIKATINRLLFNSRNYNIAALDSMVSDKAMLGISSLKEGTWSNSEIAINDFFESVKNRERSPYCEIPNT